MVEHADADILFSSELAALGRAVPKVRRQSGEHEDLWGGMERSMSSSLNFGGAGGCEEGKTEGSKEQRKTPASEDEVFILQFRIWLKDVNPMVCVGFR